MKRTIFFLCMLAILNVCIEGFGCRYDSDCVKNVVNGDYQCVCSRGACIPAPAGNPDYTCKDTGVRCNPDGAECADGTECCSQQCVNHVCGTGGGGSCQGTGSCPGSCSCLTGPCSMCCRNQSCTAVCAGSCDTQTTCPCNSSCLSPKVCCKSDARHLCASDEDCRKLQGQIVKCP